MHYGFLVPPSEDYVTQLISFPGTNAHEPWGLHGSFRLGARLYSKGAEVAVVDALTCDERGSLRLDFETPLKAMHRGFSGFGILLLESDGSIPVEIYLSHIHRKTGVYFAYPALMFMGDLLYPHAHIEQMENSMFWPGFPMSRQMEFRLVVLNPNSVPMSFEITLWHNQGGRHLDEVRRVGPYDSAWFSLDELAPAAWSSLPEAGCSLCVTAQYKLLAYMVLVNRRTGILSSADHLHPYQLR